MQRLSWACFFLAICCSCNRQDQSLTISDAIKPLTPEHMAAFKDLQGTWRVGFSPQHDGSFSFNGEGRLITYTFEAEKVIKEFTVRLEFRYFLDPTKEPKQIDLEFYSSTEPAWIAKGIYKIEGKRLVICHARKNGARPTDFSEVADDGRTVLYLIRYNRDK